MLPELDVLIRAIGTLGVAAIVFTESGLLVGVVLPGDSLLFTAGLLSAQGFLSLIPLLIAVVAAAIVGDNVGYWLGKRYGRSVFSRRDSRFLHPDYVTRAEAYFAAHGPKTIILARFVPVVRTLAPILAGIGAMPWRTFFAYNIVGALLWGVGLILGGYWLGTSIPNPDKYLLPIVGVIVIVSILPGIWHFTRDWWLHRRGARRHA